MGWNEHLGQDDFGEVSQGQVTCSPAGMRGLLILLKAKWGALEGETYLFSCVKTAL